MALLKRLWLRIKDHNLSGRSAQLSYYFLLSLFPLLIFLVTLLGYFAQSTSDLRASLLHYLGEVMPYSALTLVHTTLDEISAARGGGKLGLSLLAAIWVSSSGMVAISDTLNTAYNVKETRTWWKVRSISVLLTIAIAVLTIIALAIVLYGGKIGDALALRLGYASVFTIAWQIFQWPIVFGFLLLVLDLIYYFGPNVQRLRWHWWTSGSLVAVALWLLISLGLRAYLHFFNSYSVTYGSLGAVIVLMLWLYLTGFAILIGGEINSELGGY